MANFSWKDGEDLTNALDEETVHYKYSKKAPKIF